MHTASTICNSGTLEMDLKNRDLVKLGSQISVTFPKHEPLVNNVYLWVYFVVDDWQTSQ